MDLTLGELLLEAGEQGADERAGKRDLLELACRGRGVAVVVGVVGCGEGELGRRGGDL